MTVSIIIAVKTWQKNLEECVGKCRELDFPGLEILVLPDEPFESGLLPEGRTPVIVIPTGQVSPAHKRDLGLKSAKGEIIAFLDDDAWPEKDWLESAVRHFENDEIAAVAGPAKTPLDDGSRQKASGEIYSSILVSGKYVYRYVPKESREVDDYPSCNFIVRKSIMQQVGGFNTDFWPGEDTKLCLDITKRLGKKIIYDPQVLVYHHRRPVFIPHLKQIASYALHRGYFVKRYPETSLRPAYFLPSIFVLGLILGALASPYIPMLKVAYLSGIFLYLFLVLIFSFSNGLGLIWLIFFGIILTHVTYGVFFLKGLLIKRLPEESY
jgi:cellulose synthase/poly-beta-1,6-N-acetylglucosamine synthase-like glycosyltransferase